MIFAELRGKIRSTGTRLHERAEDALTSTAFGLLRYVPGNEGLSALLRRTLKIQLLDNTIVVEKDPSWLGSYYWSRDPMFWPRYRHYGEPDLLLKAIDSAGTVNAVLVIEAKYLSAKSGEGDDDIDYESAIPDADQLLRYWQLVLQEAPKDSLAAVVYLTAHSSPPLEEFRASFDRPQKRGLPPPSLGWLSWSDVWAVATTFEDVLPMRDLARLLAHKGLKRFTGFSSGELPMRHCGHVFIRKWFKLQAPVLPEGSLWRPE